VSERAGPDAGQDPPRCSLTGYPTAVCFCERCANQRVPYEKRQGRRLKSRPKYRWKARTPRHDHEVVGEENCEACWQEIRRQEAEREK
jgi:hypothetical protein